MVAGEDLGAAARALARGEPLRALASAGRGESAPAVLLRGIAYAQLGDLELARRSLERAVTLAPNAATNARARAALVEIAMATGDARAASTDAAKLAGTLDRLGDARNSAMLRLVQARAEVLLGHLGEARELVDDLVRAALPADLRAVAYLARAEIAVRAGRALDARDALAAARAALADTPNGLLARELVALEEELSTPVAVLIHRSDRRSADLFAIEAAGAGDALLVDACRRQATTSRATVPFAKRSVLFALLLELARVWPSGLARDELAARAFDTRRVNPSHRSRLPSFGR